MVAHGVEGHVLRLEVQPSRTLLRMQFFLHGLALMVLAYPLGVPLWLRIGLFIALGTSLFFLLRNEALIRVRRLLLDGHDQWYRIDEGGQREPLRLRDDTWLGHRVAVLRFDREQGRPLNVLILPDNLDADSFRRLRVRLRHASADSGVSSFPG